jgi:hypothetical protein
MFIRTPALFSKQIDSIISLFLQLALEPLKCITHNAIVCCLKKGAFGSLLITTIVLLRFTPARCWIAPEIPMAMYRLGLSVFLFAQHVHDVAAIPNLQRAAASCRRM